MHTAESLSLRWLACCMLNYSLHAHDSIKSMMSTSTSKLMPSFVGIIVLNITASAYSESLSLLSSSLKSDDGIPHTNNPLDVFPSTCVFLHH